MTINATKFSGYAIFEPEDSSVTKLSGYAIFESEDISVSKLSGYAILFGAVIIRIDQWRDKSLNNFILTQSGNERPILILNALNNLPLVKFDATYSQVLNFNSSLDLSGGYSYVGVLVKENLGILDDAVETLGNTSGSDPAAIQWFNGQSPTAKRVYISNEIGYGESLKFIPCENAIVVSATVSSTNNVQLFVNGVDVTDPIGMTAFANPDGTFNLFGFGNYNFSNGYFGEQKFWKGVLTNFDLLNETTAMMAKWGITVCPPATLALWLDPSDPATITIVT